MPLEFFVAISKLKIAGEFMSFKRYQSHAVLELKPAFWLKIDEKIVI